jgi:hypothetical protein
MSDQDSFTTLDWLRLLATITWLCIFVFFPRLTLGITFILVGGMFIAYNAMMFWESVIRGGGGPSPAPLVGGLCAAMGILFLPIDNAWLWALIPLAIDWGGVLPMLYGFMKTRNTP